MKSIKEILIQKRIKQVELSKALGIDPSKLSLVLSGIVKLPEKYHEILADYLGLTSEEVKAGLNANRGIGL